MPGITYTSRFHRRDRCGCIPEEQEYIVLAEAWESFRLFAEPDSAEMYTRIELVSFDWEIREVHPIASMSFAEPYSC